MQSKQSTPISMNGVHENTFNTSDIQTTIHITISPNTLLPNQPTPHIYTQLNQYGYSGLMGLLQNAHLLALHNHRTKLHPYVASYMQSCVEATANTLGDAFYVLCTLQADNHESITPQLLADFGAMMGELLPYLSHLSAELAEQS